MTQLVMHHVAQLDHVQLQAIRHKAPQVEQQ